MDILINKLTTYLSLLLNEISNNIDMYEIDKTLLNSFNSVYQKNKSKCTFSDAMNKYKGVVKDDSEVKFKSFANYVLVKLDKIDSEYDLYSKIKKTDGLLKRENANKNNLLLVMKYLEVGNAKAVINFQLLNKFSDKFSEEMKSIYDELVSIVESQNIKKVTNKKEVDKVVSREVIEIPEFVVYSDKCISTANSILSFLDDNKLGENIVNVLYNYKLSLIEEIKKYIEGNISEYMELLDEDVTDEYVVRCNKTLDVINNIIIDNKNNYREEDSVNISKEVK